MRNSDHFDGTRYYNPGIPERSLWDLLKWQVTRRPAKWPKKQVIPKSPPAPPARSNETVVSFINHATHLIQSKDFTILTDPIWSERASPFEWIGPKRVHSPGIDFVRLPKIDFVLLSHNHYDHLDIPTLKKLWKRDAPKFLTGKGVAALLEKNKMGDVEELDWWESTVFDGGLEFIFTPTQHFSARSIFDRNKTLWGGFFIRMRNQSIYFCGDTGYCSIFKEVRNRLGPPHLAILPIGAYEPRWFMQSVHMSAREAAQAHLDLEAMQSMASHFGTFQMTDEAIDEPPRALREAMRQLNIVSDSFWVLEPGESRILLS